MNSVKQKHPQRVLIFFVGNLGDTIVALPALWALRQHFLTSQLTLLSRASEKGYLMPEQILPVGLVDNYIHCSYSSNLRSLLPLLREGQYSTLVYLYLSDRPYWRAWRDLTFFRLAGIKNFVATRGLRSIRSFPQKQSLPTVEHEADHLLRRLALSGISVPPPAQGNFDLGLTLDEIANADAWLKDNLSSDHYNNQVSLVGLGPGSKMPAKVWPEERFAELGHLLINELGVLPIIFGGKEDQALGDRLIAQWKTGVNAAGALNIRQAAAALSRCRLYVGNDTGTMHLAVAAKIPCVAIFSARDCPGKWDPYGNQHIVLRESVPCEGCMLEVCDRDMECIKKISVGSVVEACACLLSDS
jgi:heptosyltransferase-3